MENHDIEQPDPREPFPGYYPDEELEDEYDDVRPSGSREEDEEHDEPEPEPDEDDDVPF